MRACIIAVGSELLTPSRTDTNSLAITERLNAVGIDVRFKTIVGDDVDELSEHFSRALALADIIVLTGGLGPTEDDVTRDAVARVLNLPLEVDEPTVERIRARFARRRMTMPEINRRQAMVPRGATLLDNPNGTAPGLWLEHGSTAILLLPGPPREMTPMLDAVIAARLATRSRGARLYRRVVRLTGRSESDVDQHAQPIYSRWIDARVPITTTILAVLGQIELHLTARAGDRTEADSALDAAVAALTAEFGDVIYSVDGRALEAVVGDLLRARRLKIAVAESCTGGLLASRLTDVPGSSDYVERGAVVYSNRSKTGALFPLAPRHLPRQCIELCVRVEAPGDEQLRNLLNQLCSSSAGPAFTFQVDAIAVQTDDDARVRTFQFLGGREMVKFQASQAALNMVRLMLRAPSSS